MQALKQRILKLPRWNYILTTEQLDINELKNTLLPRLLSIDYNTIVKFPKLSAGFSEFASEKVREACKKVVHQVWFNDITSCQLVSQTKPV